MATLDGAAPGAFAARFEEIRGDVLDAKGDKPAAVRAWRKALETDVDGSVDRRAVDLKITDLLADGVVADDAPPAAAAAPTETPAAQAASPAAAP